MTRHALTAFWTFPLAVWGHQMRMASLMAQSNTVIALRVFGAGFGTLPRGETMRMIAEKPPVFADAMTKASVAALRGATGIEIAKAWVRPLDRKTRANARRLSRRR